MKLSAKSIAKLEAQGFNHWVKDDMDRIYLEPKDLFTTIDFYKTGNVRYAELNGEKITNTKARSLVLSKLYVDAKTGELVGAPEMVDLAIAKYGLVEDGKDNEEVADDTEDTTEENNMKKVTFVKNGADFDVEVADSNYGKLTFDADRNIWVLWPDDIDDGVSYSEDLKETQDTIIDELNADQD